MNGGDERREAFYDELAAVIDGEPAALQRHADFLADDDDARDLRFEASQLAARVAVAGDDFVALEGLADRVLSAIGDVAPEPAGRTTRPGFTTGSQEDALDLTERDAPQAEASRRVSAVSVAEAASPDGLAHTRPLGSERGWGPSAVGEPSVETASDVPDVEPQQGTDGAVAGAAASERGDRTPSKGERSRWGVLLALPAVAVASLAAAAVIGVVVSWDRGPEVPPPPTLVTSGIDGTLEEVSRAISDNVGGVTVRPAGEQAFVSLSAGEPIPSGATVRTDDRTRARVRLADGSSLVLNHETELELIQGQPRTLRVGDGELVAEIAHLDGAPNAIFVTPSGRVEVLGTKFVLSANEELTSVRVSRGVVQVNGSTGAPAEVRAGEEGIVSPGGAPSVSPVTGVAGGMAWSELAGPAGDAAEEATSLAGIGSLRAHRPGEREERDRPLTLSRHSVRVRIVGNVARTEIEEVFRNDGDQVLEGVYRFPLPPDARIARLALDVDGRMEEGAFVERDRAARIWRGVIRNATPQRRRIEREEFIWVPGPWRDPAILEWQRGGQFELRIFPIPAHGERRVVLAYTQTVQPQAGRRRYVYPLAHSADDSTRVGSFDVDVRVAGAERVTARGYRVTSAAERDATRLRYREEAFSPKGDLIIDYELPGGERDLRWWTYRGEAALAPPADARNRDREVLVEQRRLADDERPYVAFALRPQLPRATARRARDFVFVVDASQSMVGERFERSVRMTAALVREMDRRDRFTVLACDYTCRTMPGGLRGPSGEAADATARWLSEVEPAGASDLVAVMREAEAMASGQRREGREVHLTYIGDGVSTAGYRRAASVGEEVRRLASDEGVVVNAIGIGGDADTVVLRALARSSGGHYVPYVPGQRVSVAAASVLEMTYGASLESAELELPPGLSQVAPVDLPTLRAGQEVIVSARMDRERVTGNVIVRGTVAGRPFEQRYPVELVPTEAAGNRFVPRLWASSRIEQLELEGRGEQRAKIIALSKAFGVMSRHTSLLVLESEAMFRAFRVDRREATVQWTGEEDVVGGESSAESSEAVGDGWLGGLASAPGGQGRSRPSRDRAPAPARAAAPAPRSFGGGGSGPATGADMMDMMEGAETAQPRPPRRPPVTRRSRRRPGRWMRRVRVRVGEVRGATGASSSARRRASDAEDELRANPDSRDRHRDAVRALIRAQRLERALEVIDSWMERDRADTEALVFRADVLGRMGERDRALRLLTGVVDLAPGSESMQRRLAEAFERSGRAERACAHRIALAELDESDAGAVAAAMRCERSLGRDDAASRLLMSVREGQVRARAERLAGTEARERRFRGDFTIDGTWSGGEDLDLTIVTPRGGRLSWMGGRRGVVGEDASSTDGERLGLRWSAPGTYLVEVSRTDASNTDPVQGRLAIRILGERRVVPFSLSGERVSVATVRVRRETRTVNVAAPPGSASLPF